MSHKIFTSSSGEVISMLWVVCRKDYTLGRMVILFLSSLQDQEWFKEIPVGAKVKRGGLAMVNFMY